MDDDHTKNPVPRSSSGEGKLWIKLKINPMKFEEGGAADEEDGIEPQRNNEPRVCTVCNKGFSSGKALGGHMRVHVQANKESLLLKKLKTSNGRSTGDEKPTCSLCGKDFPSMKSLFGHMRCHPEREWRGIQPPPAAKNSPISSSVSDPESEQLFQNQIEEESAIDLTESLPSWCVKAKRGRKALVTEDQKLFDAVNDLMRLARGDDSLESGLTHKKRVDACDFEATNSNSAIENESKKPRIYRKGSNDVKKLGKFGKRKLNLLEKDYIPGSADESDGEDQLIMSYRYSESTTCKKKKKSRKKLKLRDLESVRCGNLVPADEVRRGEVEMMVAPPQDKYKCSTCSKCFPTHQALGGHRSSHNKVRIINNQTIDECSVASGEDDNDEDDDFLEAKPMSQAEVKKEDEGEGEGAGSSKMVTESSNHQCKICRKSFSTGQALGGHQRCHWTGSADQTAASSQQAASPGEASQTGRKMLEIDLNEFPAMEEDEEDGYDYYASNSSHISSVI